jgi:hypothetical protein
MPEPRDGYPSAGRKGPTLFSFLFRSPLILFALCWLTFVGSLLLLAAPGSHGEALWRSALWRSYRTWLLYLLLGFSSAFSVVSVVVAVGFKRTHCRVRSGTLAERSAVVLYTAFACVLGLLPPLVIFTLRPPEGGAPVDLDAMTQMPGFLGKLCLLATWGGIGAAPHLFNLFDVHVQLTGALPEYQGGGEEWESQSFDEEVLWYQRLRSQLKLSLGFIATSISIAVLISGAMSHLFKEALPHQPELLPGSFAMAYGLYFTALLASAYLPASKTLAKVGEALADRLVQRSPHARATWKEWSEERQAVRTYLGLQGSAFKEVQEGLAVLTPLVASLSTLLLGMGG